MADDDNIISSKKTTKNPTGVDFSRVSNRSPTHPKPMFVLPTPPNASSTTFSPSPAIAAPTISGLPKDLGKCIALDVALLKKLGWRRFVAARRTRKDLANMHGINHPAKRLLLAYKNQGVPVKVTTPPWSPERIRQAIARGPHRSCREHIEFLSEEFVSMIQKGQWTILPYSAVKDFIHLRVSPPGVVPQFDRRPRWIVDYSFYGVNEETLPLYAEGSMQFGHALDRILRHILMADPMHGPVYLLKIDISDGFYRIDTNPDDIPRLGVVFPTEHGQEPLIAFPLVLPMGWKNSPPAFTTATETIADIANDCLRREYIPSFHPLDARAKPMDCMHIHNDNPSPTPTVAPDPSIQSQPQPLAQVDVYVDDFIGLAQGDEKRLGQVRSTLLHSIDAVFRPNDEHDPKSRAEPVSIKKLDKGDASWNTQHTILGWSIDTVAQTITLTTRRRK